MTDETPSEAVDETAELLEGILAESDPMAVAAYMAEAAGEYECDFCRSWYAAGNREPLPVHEFVRATWVRADERRTVLGRVMEILRGRMDKWRDSHGAWASGHYGEADTLLAIVRAEMEGEK